MLEKVEEVSTLHCSNTVNETHGEDLGFIVAKEHTGLKARWGRGGKSDNLVFAL